QSWSPMLAEGAAIAFHDSHVCAARPELQPGDGPVRLMTEIAAGQHGPWTVVDSADRVAGVRRKGGAGGSPLSRRGSRATPRTLPRRSGGDKGALRASRAASSNVRSGPGGVSFQIANSLADGSSVFAGSSRSSPRVLLGDPRPEFAFQPTVPRRFQCATRTWLMTQMLWRTSPCTSSCDVD